MREVVLLAVTKMLSGVCIAGVSPEGDAWVRPVKPFGTLLPGDIRYADGDWMRSFDLVTLNLLQARPRPPHVEDWTCDFVRPRPRRVRQLPETERRALLERAAQGAAQAEWQARRRSLAVFRVQDATASFSLDGYSSRYEARLTWAGSGSSNGVPVTDLSWRALGRRLLPPQGGELRVSLQELGKRTGIQEMYLAVGLSRSHQGEYWPLVLGVHCLPDYEVQLDPRNL